MISLFELGFEKINEHAKKRGGLFSWRATVTSRWRQFCNFCAVEKITDPKKIDKKTIEKFAYSNKHLAVATQQNYVSAVNSVMKLLNSDFISVGPRELVGKPRTSVRVGPCIISEETVENIFRDLVTRNFHDLAYLVKFCFYFGLRRKEACLLDLQVSISEAAKQGTIDIYRGTKGGRGKSIERKVSVTPKSIQILKDAKRLIGENICLVPKNVSLKNYYSYISNNCLPILKKHGVKRLHDLRGGFACRRYQKLVGHPAPCNAEKSKALASPEGDEAARQIISQELGHGRIQIMSAYLGRKISKIRGKNSLTLAADKITKPIIQQPVRGSREIIKRKRSHLKAVAQAIQKRFHISMDHWSYNHLRWYLGEFLTERSSGTKYRYYRIIKEFLKADGRWDFFEEYLVGPWQHP